MRRDGTLQEETFLKIVKHSLYFNWLSNTDLADVVGDSAVVDDVQSVFDCVVVALSPLKGLFVT